MNVLSLFDGISCGQIALERAMIPVKKYYALEIDKYAIKVTQHNYPNTIQLGDVSNFNGDGYDIDLLFGGSPCQGFSFAGKRLNFNDPRSALFFEYVRILKEVKPKYFLLENVRMKKEYQDVISDMLGVLPIEINSSLVSAQNRRRLYWSNIPNITQPKDKGLILKDIKEENVMDRTIKETFKKYYDESYFQKYNSKNGLIKLFDGREQKYFKSGFTRNKIYSEMGKSPTIITANETDVFEFGGRITPLESERLQTIPDNYTNIDVSNHQRYKMIGNGWTVDVIAHILKGIKWE